MTFPVRTLLASALLTATGTALAEPSLAELQEQIAALAAEIEAQKANTPATGFGKTTLGGYGEHHYNNLDSKNEADAHRFVLFVGHRFDERISFHSELEVEHGFIADKTCTVTDANGDGVVNTAEVSCKASPGEVELEQAFIEVSLRDNQRIKVGQFLMPVGFVNETHEPPTFYGVERNPVEGRLLPTTWWETGVMLSGEVGDSLGYDLGVHTGLNNAGGSIRDGRQKSAKANANEWATTARVKYRPASALELAATVQYQADLAQRTMPQAVEAVLGNAQFSWEINTVTVRGLYGQWEIDNLAAANVAREEQQGWYLETSWKIIPTVGVFARHNLWDNAAADNVDSEITQTDIGVNWWLHPQVVLKADYQEQDKAGDDDGFNLGVGWYF